MLIGLDLVAVDANSCGVGCKIRSEKLSKAELVRSRISTSSHVGSSRQARSYECNNLIEEFETRVA
jgi:hypothetical protein